MEFLILGFITLALFLLVKNVGAFTVSTEKAVSSIRVGGVPYEEDINKAAGRWGVDAALLKAVIRKESNFDPEAVSGKNCYGLMQINPMLAQDYGLVKDYKNPSEIELAQLMQVQTNINAGARFLSSLLSRYPFETAVQMYNTGISGFNKGYRAAGYLEDVKRFYNEYKG